MPRVLGAPGMMRARTSQRVRMSHRGRGTNEVGGFQRNVRMRISRHNNPVTKKATMADAADTDISGLCYRCRQRGHRAANCRTPESDLPLPVERQANNGRDVQEEQGERYGGRGRGSPRHHPYEYRGKGKGKGKGWHRGKGYDRGASRPQIYNFYS